MKWKSALFIAWGLAATVYAAVVLEDFAAHGALKTFEDWAIFIELGLGPSILTLVIGVVVVHAFSVKGRARETRG